MSGLTREQKREIVAEAVRFARTQLPIVDATERDIAITRDRSRGKYNVWAHWPGHTVGGSGRSLDEAAANLLARMRSGR